MAPRREGRQAAGAGSLGLGILTDYFKLDDIPKVAREAETNGYESIWLNEHLGKADPVSLLGSLCTQTRSVRLGACVVGVYNRHPLVTAQTFATLNELSGGRAVLGIGLGTLAWLDKLGLNHERPLAIMREALTIVKKYLDGEVVNFRGEYFTAKGIRMSGPSPRVPVYVAAVGPGMLRLAAEIADGVIYTAGTTVNYVKASAREVSDRALPGKRKLKTAALLLFAGERANDADITSYVVNLLSRPGRASAMLIEGTYSKDRMRRLVGEVSRGRVDAARELLEAQVLDQVVVSGNIQKCRERVQDYKESGLDTPIIVPSSASVRSAMRLAKLAG